MTSSGPDDAVGRRDEVSAAPQSDRALLSDGLGLLLLSTAPLRHAPPRAGGNFPNGGAAMLVADALRRHGASEGWLRDVGVGLKTLASVMVHHQSHDPFRRRAAPDREPGVVALCVGRPPSGDGDGVR